MRTFSVGKIDVRFIGFARGLTNARRVDNLAHKENGVTLIEMLVVVAIIALFAAFVLPNVMRHHDRALVVKARAQVDLFLTALGSYKLDTGVYPPTEVGLQALRVKPEGANQWAGPYLPQDVPLLGGGQCDGTAHPHTCVPVSTQSPPIS